MPQFWVYVAIATLLVTAVLVMPLLRRRPPDAAWAEDAEQRRLEVYRDRRREIERERASGRLDPMEAEQAQEDLLRQLAVDLPPRQASGSRQGSRTQRSLPALTAVALVGLVPALAFMTYGQVGAPALLESRPVADMAGTRLPPGHPPTQVAPPGRGDLEMLLAGLEQRTREAPEDGEAWAMLGMALKLQARHRDAARAFEQAITRVEPDARLLAEAAESLVMLQDGDFSGRPLEMLERALAIDAAEPSALWLMAAAQFRAGRLPDARRHLERLRAAVPSTSAQAAQVDRALARIEARMSPAASAIRASTAPGSGPAGEAIETASEAVVAGTVVVDPALAKEARRGGTLFLIARQAGGPPIPVAVRREPGASLPMSFELGDANAMTPARLLSTAGVLALEARLSRSGTANRQAGDLYGLLAAVEPGSTDLTIVIDRVVGAEGVTDNAR